MRGNWFTVIKGERSICRMEIFYSSLHFIALLVILFSDVKLVILVLLMLSLNCYIFWHKQGRAPYARYCVLLFHLHETGIADPIVTKEETLINRLGVVWLWHWNTPPPLPSLLLSLSPSTPTNFKSLRWSMESTGLDATRDITWRKALWEIRWEVISQLTGKTTILPQTSDLTLVPMKYT